MAFFSPTVQLARKAFPNTEDVVKNKKREKKRLFPLRIELRTFRVLSGCDNHYTTETMNM